MKSFIIGFVCGFGVWYGAGSMLSKQSRREEERRDAELKSRAKKLAASAMRDPMVGLSLHLHGLGPRIGETSEAYADRIARALGIQVRTGVLKNVTR